MAADTHEIAKRELPEWLIVVALGLMVLFHLLAIVYWPHLHGDVGQYLTAGQMLLDGAVPYVDIVDTNPPLIIYLNVIPAFFSRLLGIPLAVSGLFFFFALVVGTMLLFGRALMRAAPETTRAQRTFLYVCWIYASLWTHHQGALGQREQLIFLFLAPFALLRHTRYRGLEAPWTLSVPCAVLAFCAVALKPYYAIVLIVVEAVHALTFRKLRGPLFKIETAVGVGLAIVFLLHFFLVPGMDSFFGYWLPLILRGYKAYSVGSLATIALALSVPYVHVGLLLAFFLSFFAFRPRRQQLPLSAVFGWMALACIVAFVWQAKAWHYQALPVYYSVVIGLGFVVIRLQRFVAQGEGAYQRKVLAALALFLVGVSSGRPHELLAAPFFKAPLTLPKGLLAGFIERTTSRDDRVLLLHTAVQATFPDLTYAGRKFGGRFLCTYPLAFFFHDSSNYRVKKEWQADEEKFYRMLLEDIEGHKPKLVIIHSSGPMQGAPPYFTVREYLKRKGFYPAFEKRYKFVVTAVGLDAYLRRN